MADRLISKLNLRDELSNSERDALAGVLGPERRHAVGVDLVKLGASPDHATLLLSGFCGRYGLLRGGRRVFSAIHVAGDFIDLFGFLIPQLDYGVVALTPCVTAAAPHEKLRRITEDYPHLTRLLWLDTALEGRCIASGCWAWVRTRPAAWRASCVKWSSGSSWSVWSPTTCSTCP